MTAPRRKDDALATTGRCARHPIGLVAEADGKDRRRGDRRDPGGVIRAVSRESTSRAPRRCDGTSQSA